MNANRTEVEQKLAEARECIKNVAKGHVAFGRYGDTDERKKNKRFAMAYGIDDVFKLKVIGELDWTECKRKLEAGDSRHPKAMMYEFEVEVIRFKEDEKFYYVADSPPYDKCVVGAPVGDKETYKQQSLSGGAYNAEDTDDDSRDWPPFKKSGLVLDGNEPELYETVCIYIKFCILEMDFGKLLQVISFHEPEY